MGYVDPTGLFMDTTGFLDTVLDPDTRRALERTITKELKKPKSKTPWGKIWMVGYTAGAVGAAIIYDMNKLYGDEECNENDYCAALRARIKRLRKDMEKRIDEFRRNPGNLPGFGPPPRRNTRSWASQNNK